MPASSGFESGALDPCSRWVVFEPAHLVGADLFAFDGGLSAVSRCVGPVLCRVASVLVGRAAFPTFGRPAFSIFVWPDVELVQCREDGCPVELSLPTSVRFVDGGDVAVPGLVGPATGFFVPAVDDRVSVVGGGVPVIGEPVFALGGRHRIGHGPSCVLVAVMHQSAVSSRRVGVYRPVEEAFRIRGAV